MAALLLSGGMDSVSIAWWKRPTISIFVDYGQKPAQAEEAAGRAAAEAMGLRVSAANRTDTRGAAFTLELPAVLLVAVAP